MRKPDIKKTIVALTILNTVQIAIVIAIVAYSYVWSSQSSLDATWLFLLAAVLIVIIDTVFALQYKNAMVRATSQYEFLKETLSHVENLNNTLRAQRHDFMNHLQVVYGLVELDEYAEARDYISKVFNDIQKVSRILKTANPAVNALLQAKLLDCEKRDIKASLNVTSQFKEIPMPSWELCRVLGNLLDNAIECLVSSAAERCIEVDIFEDIKSYGFRVKNNGPPIPGSLQEKIFEPGFTTKSEPGHGMGLAIIRDIMSRYGGTIQLRTEDKTTVFEGFLPKHPVA